MVKKNRLIRLAKKLISIDSQNPPGNEHAIGGFVASYLRSMGLRPRIYEFKKNRANVVATLGANKLSHSLLITPHLDTVPSGKAWGVDPFAGTVRQGRLYGLGATDCKGNLACALEAMHSILETGAVLDYNLVFAATADEEAGSALGLVPLIDRGILKADVAVVLDSDDFNIIVTQKGLLHLKVSVPGRRAHGAYPWRGDNAIDRAVGILADIKEYSFRCAGNKYLRGPTINIGTIHGGDKVNVVADWCEFELDIRFLPGMSASRIIKDLARLIKRHAPGSRVKVEAAQKPYEINERHPLVHALSEAMRKVGARPQVKGSEGATVITFFQHKRIPAVATGFGSCGCAHTADEYALVDNLYRGTRALEEFLRTYSFSR